MAGHTSRSPGPGFTKDFLEKAKMTGLTLELLGEGVLAVATQDLKAQDGFCKAGDARNRL